MRPAAGRTRVLIKRIVTGAALLAGGLLLVTLFGRTASTTMPKRQQQRTNAAITSTDSTLTEMGPDGRPRIVVRADLIEQQLADDSVLLARLVMDYTAGKTGVWHVTADRGRMPPSRESLLLSGNVRVTGEPAGATGVAVISTDELAYDTRTNVVQTAAPVVVRSGRTNYWDAACASG
jgi:LPS export ABC transporter protein LptC